MGNAIRLTILAIILAIVGAYLDATAQRTPSYVQDAFNIACEISRYTCKDIRPPNVYYAYMPTAWGLYVGGDSVFISTALEPYIDEDIFGRATLLHEMVHYLQTVEDGQGAVIYGIDHWCAVEGEAYVVENTWLSRIGRNDLIRVWEKNCGKPDRAKIKNLHNSLISILGGAFH